MAVAKSQSEVETLKREIEGLRAELSRITQLNDQYRNEMLSRLTERLETRATQLEEEIKGRFYNRLKLIVWGATTLFLLGTAFGLWNVRSTIPDRVNKEVTNRVAEETEGISSRIMEKLETKLERNVEKAVNDKLIPLEERVKKLIETADSVEPILLPKRLLDASRAGDADRVKSLLKQEGVEIDVKDPEGRTPLMLAAMGGHVDVIATLISSGAAVDDQDNCGQTALWYASFNGYVDVVKKLLEAMANLELENREGSTPLIAAVIADKDDVVYALLNNGANSNARWKKEGQTPLIEATYNGNTAIVKLLLGSGAKVEEKSKLGETALDIAKRMGREDIRELLEKAGEAS